MLLTEDEAHKKICPIMRPEVMTQFNGVPYCIASACMAWRERQPEWQRTPDGTVVLAYPIATDTPKQGFCGLAGKVNP